DRLAKERKSLLRRDHASAIDALDRTAAVRIGDDAPDQHRGFCSSLRLSDDRADIQDALHRLRYEYLTAGQAPRGVAGRNQRLGVVTVLMAFVSPTISVGRNKRERSNRQRQDR